LNSLIDQTQMNTFRVGKLNINLLDELGVVLCGGHTEVTQGLDRPMVSGHMLGEVDKGKLVSNSNALVGDEITRPT
jgi:hydrogenase maturation factor